MQSALHFQTWWWKEKKRSTLRRINSQNRLHRPNLVRYYIVFVSICWCFCLFLLRPRLPRPTELSTENKYYNMLSFLWSCSMNGALWKDLIALFFFFQNLLIYLLLYLCLCWSCACDLLTELSGLSRPLDGRCSILDSSMDDGWWYISPKRATELSNYVLYSHTVRLMVQLFVFFLCPSFVFTRNLGWPGRRNSMDDEKWPLVKGLFFTRRCQIFIKKIKIWLVSWQNTLSIGI